MRVLLNVDLGELPGEAPELYALAHLANVACGGHAGDEASMRAALTSCARHGTLAGAHPSYPDRAGFGRSVMTLPEGAVRASVASQCAALAALARALGVPLGHMKPHGALYHAANADPALADEVLEGASEGLGGDFTVVGPPGGALAVAATRKGLAFAREGFADRAMRADGSLVPRGEPGAVLTDPRLAAEQAGRLARSGRVETVCVHGDTADAVNIARAVRAAL